ncbi:MAG: hypothetical protein KAT00_06840 [Planctomycetes bacterium]|nr:hypothetical protein [Planctomycetota bacterium]
MLVKLGALVSEARGSTGGTVFSRNRYGAYTRNRTKPVDPSTAGQNDQRTRMSNSVVQWRALTDAQRIAFNAKALVTDFTNRIGESFHPSGMNLFIRSANLLQQAGLAAITVPPVTPIIDDAGCFSSYDVGVGLNLNASEGDWPANAVLLTQYAIDLSNSTNYFKGPYTLTASVIAASFVAGVSLLVLDANLQADSVQAVAWHLVAPDGATSAIRRRRTFKP